MKLSIILMVVVVILGLEILESESTPQRGLGRFLGRGFGGSGKPRLHFVPKNNRKSARDAAQTAGKGNPPIEHKPHKPWQHPHFHPADRNGNIIKDGSHYLYPRRGGKGR